MTKGELFGLLEGLDDSVESWKDMFIAQPPVTRVVGWIDMRGRREARVEVEKEGGVRVKDVLEKMREAASEQKLKMRKMSKKEGVSMHWRFDEHFNGTRFVEFVQLERNGEGVVQAVGPRRGI